MKVFCSYMQHPDGKISLGLHTIEQGPERELYLTRTLENYIDNQDPFLALTKTELVHPIETIQLNTYVGQRLMKAKKEDSDTFTDGILLEIALLFPESESE